MSTIFKTIILALCMATAVTTFAAKDFAKTYEETFTTSRDGRVELFNKYGNINITTVSGDEVRIKVEVLVDAKNQDSADEIFERINISINESGRTITAETTIDDTKNFWKNLKSWGSNNRYEIHYEVELPSYVYLNLRNKYGNINCDDMDNDMDIELKYGNFNIGSAHDMDINLGYGNGELTHAKDIDAEIKYAKLKMDKCGDMDITSKYSTVTIDEGKTIESDSKYDHYKLGDIGTFENEGKYDDIRIDHVDVTTIGSKYTNIDLQSLGIEANIETGYGSIDIDEISPDLRKIEINSSYANITMDNPNDVGYEFDIETKYGSINVDNSTGDFGEDDNEEWAKGKRNGNGNGTIVIESRHGRVRLR